MVGRIHQLVQDIFAYMTSLRSASSGMPQFGWRRTQSRGPGPAPMSILQHFNAVAFRSASTIPYYSYFIKWLPLVLSFGEPA
jgi:hypothetical protein